MTMAEHDAILDATQAECVAEMKLIIPKQTRHQKLITSWVRKS